jgi:transposase
MKITRGMQRKSAKLARRRQLIGLQTLIAGIDIAKRESVVVFMRASDKARVGQLRIPTSAAGMAEVRRRGQLLQERLGLDRLVLGMEATSHFWKILARAARDLELSYVIVQSMVLARSRELEDLTRDKNDPRDAALIGELIADLRFTEVQLETGVWAELRLLGEAHCQRRIDSRAALAEQRAFLELVWPELLEQVPDLAGSHLQAALRLGLTPIEMAALSLPRFTARLRREYRGRLFMNWMAQRIWNATRGARLYDETSAASLRIQQAGQRWLGAEQACAVLETRMAAVFSQTDLGWMRGQLKGLGDVLLINLLAVSGDPRRFDDAGCMCKLAGSNPTERSSGEVKAAGGIHRRGRPTLRFLAHQAAINLVHHHPDFRQRFLALTQRQHGRLTKKQAYVAVANKVLRTLWAMAVTGQPYSSAIARGELRQEMRAA